MTRKLVETASKWGNVMVTELMEKVRAELARELNSRPVITSWDRLLDYCQVTYQASLENFHVLYLDRSNRLIKDHHHGTGTVDHVPVYPREIMCTALLLNASAVILIHNHPSGNPEPSPADIEMTKQIVAAAETLGIVVHDHIIVGKGTETSFRSKGLI